MNEEADGFLVFFARRNTDILWVAYKGGEICVVVLEDVLEPMSCRQIVAGDDDWSDFKNACEGLEKRDIGLIFQGVDGGILRIAATLDRREGDQRLLSSPEFCALSGECVRGEDVCVRVVSSGDEFFCRDAGHVVFCLVQDVEEPAELVPVLAEHDGQVHAVEETAEIAYVPVDASTIAVPQVILLGLGREERLDDVPGGAIVRGID